MRRSALGPCESILYMNELLNEMRLNETFYWGRGRMKEWDRLYRTADFPKEVYPDVIEIADFFKTKELQRVLDLACGAGRNACYLADCGFSVYGIDISEVGIQIAKATSQEKSLEIEFRVGSIYDPLPYATDFFDAILCIRSLHHGRIADIQVAIPEMERVLKPGGFVYLTVRHQALCDRRSPFKEIAPRTHIPLTGKEQGIIHYLFTEALLRKEFHHFTLHRFGITRGPEEWGAYYYLLGELV